METSQPLIAIPPKLFLGMLSFSIVLILVYPWILGVIIISFGGGYYCVAHFHTYSEQLREIFQRLRGKVPAKSVEITCDDPFVPSDPLQQQLLLLNLSSAVQGNCKVCTDKNCHRDGGHYDHTVKSSPSIFQPKPFVLPKLDDLKIDPRLDASISRFCTVVFDYYVSPSWAPYETRKQLKLGFKKLLTVLGERIKAKFILSEKESLEKFSMEKLIPLLLHYLKKIQGHSGLQNVATIFPQSKQKMSKLKVSKLCRHVLEQSLNEEDKKCRLSMELCVAVLSDGVCWNLLKLGRDKLPELLQDYLDNTKFSRVSEEIPPKSELIDIIEPKQAPEQDANSRLETQESDIPFLLDNFLDRKDSLEQPDPIISRWRPTLKDIIEETELLYPLIQHLKHVGGQKALAYLQAVLDDSPDAKDYCRRVLEIEYLPGFCRSDFFHESMGLNRVEQGLEVITDGSPVNSKRAKGHSRSASYGSKSNPVIGDLLKIEGGVVEGLPLYYDPDYVTVSASVNSSSSSSGYSSAMGAIFPGAGVVDADSIFRKKIQLEDIVTKFFSSTLSPGTAQGRERKVSDAIGDRMESVPRVGIDSKSYQEWDHPEVNRRVQINGTKCDIFESTSDILTSSITANSWLGPVLSGWIQLLQPYIKPYFDSQLEAKLGQFLTLDLFIKSVDLITDAFIHSGDSDPDLSEENSSPASSQKNIPLSKDNANISGSSSSSNNISESRISSEESQTVNLSLGTSQAVIVESFLKSFLNIFISNVISLDKFLISLSTYRDYIFLFFIDVLDLLVSELFNSE